MTWRCLATLPCQDSPAHGAFSSKTKQGWIKDGLLEILATIKITSKTIFSHKIYFFFGKNLLMTRKKGLQLFHFNNLFLFQVFSSPRRQTLPSVGRSVSSIAHSCYKVSIIVIVIVIIIVIDRHGLPAYSHHDKIPPWWEYVSNDKGGNVSVNVSISLRSFIQCFQRR